MSQIFRRTLFSAALFAASVAFAQTDTTRTAPADTTTPVVTAAPSTPTTCPCSPVADTGKKTGRFSILGMFSIPQGEFGDDADAENGFGIGAEMMFPLQGSPNTNVVFGAYYFRNGVDTDSEEDEYTTVSGGEWNSFSLLGGVRFQLPELEGVYVQGMAGLSIASENDIEYTDEYWGEEIVVKVGTGRDIAFSIGAGKQSGPWDFGIRYLNMGEPKFKAKVIMNGDEQALGSARLKMSMLVLSVGYSF